ncbi:hypothetical protein SSPIM334S_01313 [Streptomyces spiroverticillatus]
MRPTPPVLAGVKVGYRVASGPQELGQVLALNRFDLDDRTEATR